MWLKRWFLILKNITSSSQFRASMSLLTTEEKTGIWRKGMLIKAISSLSYSVCLFPFKRSPLFKVEIKIDILETQLIRHNEAEPHFNFRDSGRYVKNTPKRIISYLYDRWQLLQPHKRCLYSHSHPDFYRGETITSHSNLMGFEHRKSSDRLEHYHITFQRTQSL